MQRNKKAVSLIYLACGAIGWLLFREILDAVWVAVRLPMFHDWPVAPYEILAAVIGIVIFIALLKNERVVNFTNEVITELSKVVWPQKKETVLSTGIVSVLVGICAMILFVFDIVWGSLVKIFYQ